MSPSVTSDFVRQFFDLLTTSPPASPISPFNSSGRPPPITQGPSMVYHGSSLVCGIRDDAAKPVELTADVLEQILIRCDIETLVGTVPTVCKSWRAIACSSNLWHHRLSPKLMSEVKSLAALGPLLSPSRLFLITQGRNFLRNPTFRPDANNQPQLGRAAPRSKYHRSAWVTTTTMGDGISWEMPPAGVRTYGTAVTAELPSPLPYPGTSPRQSPGPSVQHLQGFFGNGSGGFGIMGCAVRARDEHQPSCLATANDWCEVVQVVDFDWELQRRGLTAAQAAHLLDSELGLRFTVQVGSRWDSVGQYSIGLLLDEGNGNANGYGYGTTSDSQRTVLNSPGHGGSMDDHHIPSLQSFVMRPTRHHFYTGGLICPSDSWHRFEYVLPSCPRGFRRAVLVLRGRRAPNTLIVSPMPRYCGAKFTCAELVFM